MVALIRVEFLTSRHEWHCRLSYIDLRRGRWFLRYALWLCQTLSCGCNGSARRAIIARQRVGCCLASRRGWCWASLNVPQSFSCRDRLRSGCLATAWRVLGRAARSTRHALWVGVLPFGVPHGWGGGRRGA